MTDPSRRVWRAGPATLAVVWIFTALTVVAVPGVAYLIYTRGHSPVIPVLLLVLTVLMLLYAWRFGLHPQLRVDRDTLEVVNPFRRHRFEWADVAVIAPGENGLVVASEDDVAEVWCVQKSNYASRRGRFTRADRVAHELLDLLDQHDPPLEDEQTGLRIRRARPDEARVLTRIERAASEEVLSHVFPPEHHPYPVAEVTQRWGALLRDPQTRVHLLEHGDTPVGYVAFDAASVRHLGVVPHRTRRGYGSALLEFACREIYDAGAREASLWVLSDNHIARAFYLGHHWTETAERRRSEFPPRPEMLKLTKVNPAAPRRSR